MLFSLGLMVDFSKYNVKLKKKNINQLVIEFIIVCLLYISDAVVNKSIYLSIYLYSYYD